MSITESQLNKSVYCKELSIALRLDARNRKIHNMDVFYNLIFHENRK